MKRDHRQPESVPSSTENDANISEAALLEWIRPSSRGLTFDQLIDDIALDTLPDPRLPSHAGIATQSTVVGGELPAQTNEIHLTQTGRG